MNTNQLETLLAISKTMSFRKAGELLNLTQPAVSAQIKNLEEQFDITLIDRTQPITLTDQGIVFLEHAERIIAEISQLKQRLLDLNDTPQGHVVLGTTTSIAIRILPKVLAYFQNQYPRIQTSIHSMSSSQIMQSVESGTIDIGIGYLLEEHRNLHHTVLYHDTFEVVVSPLHPLNQVKKIKLKMLEDYPFILLSSDTVGRKFVDQIFRENKINPTILIELSSSEEIKRMAEINLGVAVVSKLSVFPELERGTLKNIAVKEFEATHPIGVVYKEGRYLNSAMQQFLQDLNQTRFTNEI